MAPATKRGRAGFVRDAVGPLAALPGGLLVDFPGEVVEEFVSMTLLIKRRVFASAVFARVSTKNSLWPMLVAENVFVSMMSAPASRKRRWMSPITSGCVSE